MRVRSLSVLLLVLVLGLGSACGAIPNRRLGRMTVPASPVALRHISGQPTDATCGTTQGSSTPLVTGSHVQTISRAYRAILQNFVRPLDSSNLLNAAWQGAVTEASKEGVSDPGVPLPQLPGASADADWQAFAKSYDALSQATDGKVDQVKLAFEAISQMAMSVQEGHTFFLDPEEYAQESGGKEAQISGIGVVLNGNKPPFVVEETVTGGPADQAGIRPGDTLVGVNGCDISDWDSLQLVTHVRGTAGSPVHLSFDRPSSGTYDIDVTRAQVTFPAIESRMLPSGIGYIHLNLFPSPRDVLVGGKPLVAALTDILSSFQSAGAKGWILDLRENPGGEVDGLQAVGGLILQPGVMFSFNDRAGNKVQERTLGNRITDPPLTAVLVDGGSASSSEILAAAVQDEQIAPIIGSKTAGVANGAQLFGIGDGAGIQVTHFQTYTRDGIPLNGTGVTPDISAERTAQDLVNGVDPAIDAAVKLAT